MCAYRLLPAAAFAFCCLPLFWRSALFFSFKERMRMLVGSVLTIWSSADTHSLRQRSKRSCKLFSASRQSNAAYSDVRHISQYIPGGSVLCWQT